MSVIETERLHLRPFVAADIPDVLDGIGRWEVVRWLRRIVPHPYTLEDARWWIAVGSKACYEGHPVEFAIASRDTDRVIGGIGILVPQMELGFWLNPSAQGQGLMIEALSAVIRYGFDTLGLPRLCANVRPDNARSKRVLAKAGLEAVGTRPMEGEPWEAFDAPSVAGYRLLSRYEITEHAWRVRHNIGG